MAKAASISQQIWDMKYRLKGADGEPVDKTVADTWRRVARALAEPERDPAAWERRFFEAMEDFRFLPGGRIFSGAARARATRRQVSETVLSTGSPSAPWRRYFMSQICWEIDAAFAITAPAGAGSPGRRPRSALSEARKSLKTQCFQWFFQNPL